MICRRPAFLALVTIFWALWLCAMPQARAAEVKATKLLILPFEVNAGQDLQYLNDNLPQLLVDKLTEAGFDVVPLSQMRQLVADHHVQVLDLQTAKDLALLAGAGYVLYGSFSQVGESISIDSRLQDAFGLKPVKPIYITKQGLLNILPAVEEVAERVRLELMQKDRIADIDVQGLQYLDRDVVLLRIESQKGDIFDPAKVNHDLKRIYDLGYFDDVQAGMEDSPGGKRLIFTVKEKPRIGAISIVGAKEISEDDVREVMATQSGSVLNPTILADDLNKIRDLYRKKGYYKAVAAYKLEGEGGAQARLNIVITEGQKLYVKKIEIKGAEQLDESDIKGELALSERGFLSWITGSGVLKEELLDRDTAAIEAYYANHGFIDAKVAKPQMDFRDDGIYVTFEVQEGNRYTVDSVNFRGELLATSEELSKLTVMPGFAERHEFMDRSKLREDTQKLVDYYTDFGYAFAECDLDVKPDRDKRTVAITYILTKNQKVHIRRVVTEGNLKTRENVILREMRLADGDLFSGSKLARSNQRLTKLDFFDQVDIETLPTGRDDELDLKVKVKEKSTGMASVGVGYSSYSSVFIGGKIQERNLFGLGYIASFSGMFSGKETAYTLSFTNPHVYDTNLAFGVDTYVLRDDYIDYDKDTVGGKLRLGYPIGEYSRATLSYRLDNFNIKNVSADAAREIRDEADKHWASVAGLLLNRDTTNRAFNPNKGNNTSINLEYGGGPLGGDDNFIKPVFDYNYYHDLFWKTIFHFHGQLGFTFRNLGGEEVPTFERFYLGGLNSVRGYKERYLSPRDPDSGDRVGGSKELFFNVENIFPIQESLGLHGVLFFDAGNSWSDDRFFFDQTNASVGDVPGGLFKSYGGGIRWLSPLGPLRVEYGIPLDELKDSNKSGRIEFSMGATF